MSWGYVQGKFGSGTGSQASLTVTPVSAFNVGDLVIASYSLYSNTTATVGDASGGINTWTQLTRELASGAVCGMAWTVVQSGGTSLGVKLTPASNNYMSMQVDEYSITGSAITFSNTAGTTGSAGTAMSGNLTFASSGSFLLHSAFTQPNTSATWTGGAGWTVNVASVGGSGYEALLTQYLVELNSAASPVNPSCTTNHVWGGIGVCFQETTSGSSPASSVFFPDRATAFLRATNDSYLGLLSGQSQAQYDGNQPSGVLWLPDQYRVPVRSTPPSYGGLSFQQIADLYQPSGSPVWPGAAKASARAASYDVAIWQPPATTAIIVTTAGPFYPDRAPVAIRAGVTSYGGIALPQIADLNQPAGSQVWPLVSPSAKRATSYDVATWQTPSTTTLVVSAAPFYPDRSPAPLRAAVLAYDARSYQQIGDALQPPGVVVSPQVAPGYRRAATYDVSLHQPPILVAPTGPFGHPWFPERAIGLGRAAASTYSVTTLTNVPSSAPLDLGRFRLGSTISAVFPIGSQTTAPVATFSGPGGNIRVPLTTRDGTNWTLTTFLGIAYQAGTYTTTITNSGQVQFEVVAGGDYGGGVIALFATQNVNGWQVLAQLQNGSLVMGKNPRVP